MMMMMYSFFVFIGFTVHEVWTQSAQPENEDTVRILELQRSSVPSAESYARLQTPFPVLNDFTVCYFVRIHRFREESTLMSYAVSGAKDNELRMDHRITGYKVSIHSTWAKTDIVTPLGFWTHYCITFLSDSEEWEIFENGYLTAQGVLPKYDGPLEGNGAYVIGQEQDSFGGDFQRDQSFSGQLTELNFWAKKLSKNTIKMLANCKTPLKANGLAWSDMEWKINGETEWIEAERETLCQRTKRRIFFFPSRMNLPTADKFCKVLGGRVALPITLEENTWLYEESLSEANFCANNIGWSYLWLGATDQEEERIWKYYGTSKALSWEAPWRGGKPNGGTVENCMVMLYGDFAAKWSDIACLDTYSICVACEFDERIFMYLKGPVMCGTSSFNYEYFLEGERNKRPVIAGKLHSEIFWEESTKSWVLKSLKTPAAVARFTPPTEHLYPFGKNTWVLEDTMCGYTSGQSINLTLSSCGEGQYTCSDGACIALKKRCDLRLDCPDDSDEADCTLIDIPEGYMNVIPPPPTDPPNPLNISFMINILSFPSIKTQDLTYDTTMELSLQWKDQRLLFLNLKEQRSLNLLSSSEVGNIWTPKVFFSNAFGNEFTNQDEGTRVECVPKGNSLGSPRDKADERNIFNGFETVIDMSQFYAPSYSCSFDLLMFPFDAQLCSMDFTLISASAEYMILKPDAARYTGSQNLIEYTIGDLMVNQTVANSFSAITIQVRFIRRYGFYLLTLYIPSVLLVTIAYATLFFNPGDFNSRIVVALTALLVLSSLFTQTSNSLPKTSYFKLVDIWLFFSTLIIFFVVVFQTLAEYFSYDSLARMRPASTSRIIKVGSKANNDWMKNEGEEQKKCFNVPLYIIALYAGRICIPLIYIIFNLAYWASSISYLNENVWPYDPYYTDNKEEK